MSVIDIAIILLSFYASSTARSLSRDPSIDSWGIRSHEVRSPLQAGPTHIRVLLPSKFDKTKQYPVIYLLPVEARDERRYGQPLQEVLVRKLHEQFPAIFVSPTFSHLPWYADHPIKQEIRQESYFLQVVVPFVDKTYPVIAKPEGRLLLGFSKSGWGAFSLLLRHPTQFGRASAWDAPLMLDQPGKYGSGEIFATADNFQAYRISKLVPKKAESLLKEPRLLLHGYGNFRKEHEAFHAILEQHKIPHRYVDGPSRKHDWHSGWLEDAVRFLLTNDREKE